MSESALGRTIAELPAGVAPPFDVYVNGVLQRAGSDYRRVGGTLVFDRPLTREGKLGFWRWASMFLGIAGTYRRDDVVDVIYERDGRRQMATGLSLRAAE